VPSDVIVSGAGPAGALCATILARAGVRVALFDRSRFPRSKLCGDTLNPGALRVLGKAIAVDRITAAALPLDGMWLTGPGVGVRATYGEGIHGHAIVRRDLDALLLDEALRAGVEWHELTRVAAPVCDGGSRVIGVKVMPAGRWAFERRAQMVIAADGRASGLARALALSRHPVRPRRWAIGAYFEGADTDRRFGEMHVRPGHYIGVAPIPGGLTNVCLVVPYRRGDGRWRNPAQLLLDVVNTDGQLAERFARAALVDRVQVLGPMAVDARVAGVDGLLLAGDAAGFVDPITGDGLRLALESATLVAETVIDVLGGALDRQRAPRALAEKRRAAFARKLHFNRAVRSLVATPAAISGAALAARLWPAAFRGVIRYAGDATAHASPS
jgi:flavin-dependent dehydrogenase